jgi:DNA-binding GntR family transcriptional regulator
VRSHATARLGVRRQQIFSQKSDLQEAIERLRQENSASMSKPSIRNKANERSETEKAAILVVKRIRDAILDEVFKPGDHLTEVQLAEKFEVSRSPVREALLALEKEGTAIMSPYKGAIVKPLSAAEVLDIAGLRLALISLALKPAHRHLSPADFDHAYDLAKRITQMNNAKDSFECCRHFWDSIFSNAQRPILHEVFQQLEDRMTRYEPVYIKVFPTPETRPRQREVLIEIYRKGEITEALRSFKKIYLEVVDQLIDHLKSEEFNDSSSSESLQPHIEVGRCWRDPTMDLAEKTCLKDLCRKTRFFD